MWMQYGQRKLTIKWNSFSVPRNGDLRIRELDAKLLADRNCMFSKQQRSNAP